MPPPPPPSFKGFIKKTMKWKRSQSNLQVSEDVFPRASGPASTEFRSGITHADTEPIQFSRAKHLDSQRNAVYCVEELYDHRQDTTNFRLRAEIFSAQTRPERTQLSVTKGKRPDYAYPFDPAHPFNPKVRRRRFYDLVERNTPTERRMVSRAIFEPSQRSSQRPGQMLHPRRNADEAMGIIGEYHNNPQRVSTLSPLDGFRANLAGEYAPRKWRYLRTEPSSSAVHNRGHSHYPIKVRPAHQPHSLKAKLIEPFVEPKEIPGSLKAPPQNAPVDFSVYFPTQKSPRSQSEGPCGGSSGMVKTFASSISSLFSGSTPDSPSTETVKEPAPFDVSISEKPAIQPSRSRKKFTSSRNNFIPQFNSRESSYLLGTGCGRRVCRSLHQKSVCGGNIGTWSSRWNEGSNDVQCRQRSIPHHDKLAVRVY